LLLHHFEQFLIDQNQQDLNTRHLIVGYFLVLNPDKLRFDYAKTLKPKQPMPHKT